jgi:hypothetical protein
VERRNTHMTLKADICVVVAVVCALQEHMTLVSLARLYSIAQLETLKSARPRIH